ncbi:MAG: hemolysin III family protein, partial [Ruminococcus sp.]|nr:hemolysin III family protein [Ruminococcus sp.]
MINGVGRIGEGVPKRYTRGEEIVNSITHGIGSALAIAGTVVLIVFAAVYSNAWGVVGAAVFGGSMIVLYTMSTLYHAITNRRAKKFFRIMDHNTIFFLIAGTYTPITLVPLRGALGWVLFGIVWGAAVLGIVLNSINLERFKKPSVFCYVMMGWVILIAVKPMIDSVYSLSL